MSFYLKSCLHFVSFWGWQIYVLCLYKNVMHLLTVLFKWKRKHCRCISNCLLIWGMHHTVITWIQDKNKFKCILYRICIIISVLFFFLFKYFRDFLYYQKKKYICENVTVSVLMLNFADFFSPYSILSVKFIWRVLSAGHVTCH